MFSIRTLSLALNSILGIWIFSLSDHESFIYILPLLIALIFPIGVIISGIEDNRNL